VNCCAPAGAEIFDERQARKDARRYRRRGLDGTAWQLVNALAGKGGDVLEIGGGVGGIEIELLKRGAARAVNVELSPAYDPFARELIAEAGLTGRVERRVGNLVVDSDLAASADVVVMHRVVCCYPDMPALVGAAATRARTALAMTYPRDSWWTRLFARLVNAYMRLRGRAFRTFIHSPAGIRAAADAHGLHPTLESGGLLWQVVAFER
jgi:magnesium-protoporphyrin O-methyltransferase